MTEVLAWEGGMIARLILATILIVLNGLADAATAAETFRDCSVCPTMVKLPHARRFMGDPY